MSEMIEKVAKAISNQLTDNDGYLRKSYSEDELAEVARAAIAAMREPPRPLCEAAWNATRGTLMEDGYADAVDAVELHFNAVVDAALKSS